MINCAVALALLISLAPGAASAAEPRETLLMNFGWKFHKGELPVNHWGKYATTGKYGKEPGIGLAYDDSNWRALDLPHDFTVESFAPDPKALRYFKAATGAKSEVGWYRRHFTIPASDKGRRITVEFEGAFQTTIIYLNDFLVGRSESGYAPFQFDLTELINYGGDNVLSVCVDAKLPEGWWYEGGGIYRNAYLVKTGEVHVPWGGVYVQSWFQVDPNTGKAFLEDEPEGPAHLRIQTTVANKGSAGAMVNVKTKVLDPAGRQVAEGSRQVRVGLWAESTAIVETTITGPQLWSLEQPRLYAAVVELETGGRTVDHYEQTFGIRTIRYDANQGFFLNGRPIKVKGASCHQDHAGVGIAVPDAVVAFRLQRLKEFGFNGYRTAHHPSGPIARVADRVGFLVFTESRKYSTSASALRELRQMVLADRNSPSVILWGTGNEEDPFESSVGGQVKSDGNTEGAATDVSAACHVGGQVARGMRDCIHSLDPSRPVTLCQNRGHAKPGGPPSELDVIGFMYGWDDWDKIHKLYPDKPIIETEMAKNSVGRGVYEDQTVQGRLLSYDVMHFYRMPSFTKPEVKRQFERPWMCGGFIWTGFDYRGETAPFRPAEWKNHKMPGDCPLVVSGFYGAFDLCGFPKDEAWYYKAAYGSEPVLHVFPHWNWKGKEGQPIDVWVYSNCDEVDLVVNGKSQGRKPMPKLEHLSWKVPYAPGFIEAIGYKNGAEVARDKRETTGEPVAVTLVPERADLRADHEDVALVTIQAIDAAGRPVPTATNKIRFRLEGPARLLGSGNGDAATREPDTVPERSLWAGLALVLVQALDEPGTATLIAESEGLRPARLELKLEPASRRPFLPSSVKADQAMWWDGAAPTNSNRPVP
jgi:beta-galactosidase